MGTLPTAHTFATKNENETRHKNAPPPSVFEACCGLKPDQENESHTPACVLLRGAVTRHRRACFSPPAASSVCI